MMTNNVQLRNVQYKMLHNAHPTMKHLFHWGYKGSPNCVHCGIPEMTQHAIWECHIAARSLNSLHEDNRRPNITKDNFIFGIKNNNVTNTMFTIVK